jgi:hypothetical protein
MGGRRGWGVGEGRNGPKNVCTCESMNKKLKKNRSWKISN